MPGSGISRGSSATDGHHRHGTYAQHPEAGEADAEDPVRRLVRWNEYEGRFFTIRMGGGFLYEYAGFSQDDASGRQITLTPDDKVRDSRVLLKAD